MLPAEIMGALALGVLWVNTLLIAAAALKERAALGARLSALRAARAAGRLVEGRVAVAGAADAFAERRTAQIGRAMTVAGPDRILFTDKKTEPRVAGGAVELAGGGTLRVEPGERCDLWTGPEVPARRPDTLSFAEAWSSASTARGLEIDVVQRIEAGMPVWVEGERDGERLSASLVASACPVAALARGRRRLAVSALGALVGAAIVTAIALVPPVFGTVSTLGGALGLVFFLLVQPMGVAARNAARTPDRQPVGGIWQRS